MIIQDDLSPVKYISKIAEEDRQSKKMKLAFNYIDEDKLRDLIGSII